MLGSSSSMASGRMSRMRASATRIFQPPESFADIAVHHLLAEAEAREDFARAAIEGVAVEFLEAGLDFAVARDDRVHVIGAGGIGHGGFEVFQFGGDGADGAGAVHHFGDGTAAGHLADVLAEVADGDAAFGGDLAFVGLLLADDHAEQGRFAGAVGADEANLFAFVEGGRGLDEEELVAVLLADGVEANHRARGSCRSVRRMEEINSGMLVSPVLVETEGDDILCLVVLLLENRSHFSRKTYVGGGLPVSCQLSSLSRCQRSRLDLRLGVLVALGIPTCMRRVARTRRDAGRRSGRAGSVFERKAGVVLREGCLSNARRAQVLEFCSLKAVREGVGIGKLMQHGRHPPGKAGRLPDAAQAAFGVGIHEVGACVLVVFS